MSWGVYFYSVKALKSNVFMGKAHISQSNSQGDKGTYPNKLITASDGGEAELRAIINYAEDEIKMIAGGFEDEQSKTVN